MQGLLPKGSTHQGILENAIRKLFKGEEIQFNTRTSADIRSPVTGSTLEVDVWVPNLNLGFEFQDVHHYTTTWYYQRPLDVAQSRDTAKRQEAARVSATLVEIPYWWDSSIDSLIATLKFHRPELLHEYEAVDLNIIPLNPPLEMHLQGAVPDVGQLMLASFPIADSDFVKSVTPVNFWWGGEKYDGIRFCWHPTRRKLYTRLGRLILLPSTFTQMFPSLYLDGELWFGRGRFIDAQFKQLHKGCSSLISYYSGSYSKAICDLYPEININLAKFAVAPRRHWFVEENRRKLFDTYAADKGFDPLIAKNWYSVPREDIMSFKSAGPVITEFYKSNFVHGLLSVYPDIGLKRENFTKLQQRNYWNANSRRDFFVKFAEEQHFNPLIANEWYQHFSYQKFAKQKGARSILQHYGGKVSRAISQLFPNINIDPTTMKKIQHEHKR